MKPIKIYIHRLRNFIFLIASVLLGSTCYYISNYLALDNISPYINIFLIYFGLPFFGLITLYELFSLLIKKSDILISSDGVEDNTSIIKFGLISWDEIDRIFYQRYGDKEYLCIALKKPETFVNKHSALKRFFGKSKIRDTSFVTIPIEVLPEKPWNLIKAIRDSHPEIRIHYPFPHLEDMDLNPNSHLEPK